MSVNIQLFSNLDKYTGGNNVVKVQGSSVGKCLDSLFSKYPDIKKVILDKNNRIQSKIFVSLNKNNPRPENLETPVNENDVIYILQVISGG